MGYDAAFSRALRELTALAGPDDDWRLPPHDVWLHIRSAPAPCRRLLFITKPRWLDWVFPEGVFPPDVTIVQRYGLVTTALARMIRREAAAAGCPIHFVGDLDPQDLSVFHSLRLDAVVGPESMALLRSGEKLELEGASNPDFYNATFPAALRAYLLGVGV